MSQLGFSINLARCVGCRACAVACNAELNTVKGTRYRAVIEKQGGTETEPKRLFVTMSCFHCEDPACLKSCPVDAIAKDKILVALSSGDLTKALHFIIDHTSKPL